MKFSSVIEHLDDFTDKLNKHLLLMYTGKTCLARNAPGVIKFIVPGEVFTYVPFGWYMF